jgi:two-component system, response regulator PdtaR
LHALIMETDAIVALAIEDVLRDSGFTSFAFAATDDEAVAAAEQRCPDLITADKNLRAGCGIEAVQRICSKKPIPVVFVSEATHEIQARLPEAISVRKPFPLGVLSDAVTQAQTV